MYRFFKFLRITGFIILILLASFGIGLSGGVPIPSSNTRKEQSLKQSANKEEEEVLVESRRN